LAATVRGDQSGFPFYLRRSVGPTCTYIVVRCVYVGRNTPADSLRWGRPAYPPWANMQFGPYSP